MLVGGSGLLGANLFAMLPHVEWVPTYFAPLIMSCPQAVSLDLSDEIAVSVLVEQVQPRVIVHVAGITKPDVCEQAPELSRRVNVLGSLHLIAAARQHGCRLIFLSSDLVFDGKKDVAYRESDLVNPETVYGRHKVEVENLIQRELSDYLIIRTGIMYGWSPSRNSLAEWVVERLAKGEPADLFADQYRNHTFVGDMVAFIQMMAFSQTRGFVHLASPECTSKAELGREIAQAFGYDPTLVRKVSFRDFPRRASVPARNALDVTRAMSELHVHARSLREGVLAFRQQQTERYPKQFKQWYP